MKYLYRIYYFSLSKGSLTAYITSDMSLTYDVIKERVERMTPDLDKINGVDIYEKTGSFL